ncbi:MAG: hypothetical protein RBR86_08310 [Pseudobdellovibrionaceae bacterium]|jgi:hypothetical protein|nr:hypothetical protein [Pseudobdellovibrionaceae bacterium]
MDAKEKRDRNNHSRLDISRQWAASLSTPKEPAEHAQKQCPKVLYPYGQMPR